MLLDGEVLPIKLDGPERMLSWTGRDSGGGSPCWTVAPACECLVLVSGLEMMQPMTELPLEVNETPAQISVEINAQNRNQARSGQYGRPCIGSPLEGRSSALFCEEWGS